MERGPEQIFKKRGRPLLIRVRQGGFIRRTMNAEMNEFADAAAETITNISKRSRMRQLTKQHRDKLGPTGKSFCSPLGSVLSNQCGEFSSGEMLQQLIEQTRYKYHGVALLGKVGRTAFAKK